MSKWTDPFPTVSPSEGSGAFFALGPVLGELDPLAIGGWGSSFLPDLTTTKMATPTTASIATTATAATRMTGERDDFRGGGAGYPRPGGYVGCWYPGCG